MTVPCAASSTTYFVTGCRLCHRAIYRIASPRDGNQNDRSNYFMGNAKLFYFRNHIFDEELYVS